jgi:hypothetical protein
MLQPAQMRVIIVCVEGEEVIGKLAHEWRENIEKAKISTSIGSHPYQLLK